MKKYYLFLFIGVMLFAGCDYNYLENSKIYKLRDRGPAGGWIFYINPNWKADGWRYLEAAPKDTEWSAKSWSTNVTTNHGTQTGIGTGKANTSVVAAWLNTHGESANAAQLCDALVYGGYSDWFLPSIDELNEMCWVLHSKKWIGPLNADYEDNPAYGSNRVGGFIDGNYWSSSEGSISQVWYQTFTSGKKFDGGNKYYALNVRAVRAF